MAVDDNGKRGNGVRSWHTCIAVRRNPPIAAGQPHFASSDSEVQDQGDEVPARLTNPIFYVSHFLSTWNASELCCIYLATISPGTLLPMSLTLGLSAMLFAPAVGQYIDTASNLLQVVRLSIGEPFKFTVLARHLWKFF
jgi:hypothetical protein